jgi:hypothetical protein
MIPTTQNILTHQGPVPFLNRHDAGLGSRECAPACRYDSGRSLLWRPGGIAFHVVFDLWTSLVCSAMTHPAIAILIMGEGIHEVSMAQTPSRRDKTPGCLPALEPEAYLTSVTQNSLDCRSTRL